MRKTKISLAGFLVAVLLLNVDCSSGGVGGRGPSNTPAVPTAKATTLSAAQSAQAVFTDVSADSWYAQAAVWCQENGIMSGTSETTFGPDVTMTRSMLAAILHRAEGSPAVNYLMIFPDVDEESWYAEAVRWAARERIITGYDKIANQSLIMGLQRIKSPVVTVPGDGKQCGFHPLALNTAVEGTKAVGHDLYCADIP